MEKYIILISTTTKSLETMLVIQKGLAEYQFPLKIGLLLPQETERKYFLTSKN